MKAFLDMAYERYDLQKEFCVDVSRDFSRNRKLNFPRLVLLIARLCKRTLSLELERFFKDLAPFYSMSSSAKELTCSVSAFSQQRKKLDPFFFHVWNTLLCECFYQYSAVFKQPIKRWHGLRVIAADGSSVALVSNPVLKEYFGGQSNQEGAFCAAKTFYYYDALNHLILNSFIAPYRTAELIIAHNCVENLPDDAIIVYDRNFCTYQLMAYHLWRYRQKHFLIRAKEKLRFVADFLARGNEEEIIDLLPPNKDTINKMTERGFYVRADSIIRIRLVRVVLPGGGIEVLATNLLAKDEYNAQDLKELYFLRWGVETSINFQKNTLMLESFSGQTVQSVQQDFYATVVMANLQMCLMKDAQTTLDIECATGKRKGHKHRMKVNQNKASFRVKERLIDLFLTNDPVTIIAELHRYFIRDILPVRKNRSYPRVRKNRRTNSKHKTYTNYKIA
jgi:hypothetical protein